MVSHLILVNVLGQGPYKLGGNIDITSYFENIMYQKSS